MLLCGVAGLSLAAVSPSFAQKGMTLQPSTAWSIKHIKNADQTSSYCAIARRYKNDIILSIAQNYDDESSLALDFKNEGFDVDQSFDITLDAGAGQVRQFDVYPVSRKAFVVRLGRDDSFFSALNRTGYLRVELRGRNYNFNLADIDRGRKQLTGCLGTNAKFAQNADDGQTSSSTSDSQAYQELASRISELEKQNNELQKDLRSAQDEYYEAKIQSAPTPLNILPEQEISPIPAIPPPGGVVLSENEENRREQEEKSLSNLLKARPATSQGLSASRQQKQLIAAAKAKNSQELTSEEKQLLYRNDERYTDLKTLDYLRSENDSLRKALQENPKNNRELHAMKITADQLSSENAGLQNQIEKMHQIHDEFVQQLGTLNNQKDDLENLLKDTNAEKQEIGQKMSFLETQLFELETEHENLKHQLALTEKRVSIISTERETAVNEAKNINEKSKSIIQELKERILGLEEERAELSGDLLNSSGFTDKLSKELKDLSDENLKLKNELDEQLRASQMTREEVLALSHRISDLRADNEDLKKQVEELKLLNLKQQEDFISKLEAENTKLLEALKKQKSYQEQVTSLSGQVEVLTKENQELVSELGITSSEFKTAKTTLEQRLNDLAQARTDLDVSAKAKESYELNIAQLQNDLAQMKLRNEELNIDLGEAQKKLDEKIAAITQQDEKHAALIQQKDQEIAVLRQEKVDVTSAGDQEKSKFQASLAEKDVKIESLLQEKRELLEAKDAELALLRQENEKASSQSHQEVAKIMNLLSKKTDEIDQLRVEKQGIVFSYEEKFKELEKQLTSKESEVESLRSEQEQELKDSDQKSTKLLNLVSAKEEEVDTLRAEKAMALAERDDKLLAMEKQLKDKEAELKELEQKQLSSSQAHDTKLKNLESELMAQKAEIERLAGENKELLAGNDKISDKMSVILSEKDQEIKRLQVEKEQAVALKNQEITDLFRARDIDVSQKLAKKDEQIKRMELENQREFEALRLQTELELERLERERQKALKALKDVEEAKRATSARERLVAQKKLEQQESLLAQKAEEYQRQIEDQRIAKLEAEERVASMRAAKVKQAALEKKTQSRFVDYLAEEKPVKTVEVETKPEPQPLKPKAVLEKPGLNPAQEQEIALRQKIDQKAISPPPPGKIADLKPAIGGSNTILPKPLPSNKSSAEPERNIQTISKIEIEEPKKIEMKELVKPAPIEKSKPIVKSQPSFSPSVDVENLLETADIPIQNDVKKVPNADDQRIAYQWQSAENLYGSAQQSSLKSASDYREMVQRYLQDTESRCSGDFAVLPTDSLSLAGKQIDSYEIACVGAGIDSSASLLFFSEGSQFTAIAHESSTENMARAMDIRDRIAKVVETRS